MKREKIFWWIVWALTLTIVIAGLTQTIRVIVDYQVNQGAHISVLKWAIRLGVVLAVGIVCAFALIRWGNFLRDLTVSDGQANRPWRITALIIFAALLLPLPVFLMDSYWGLLLSGEWIHLLLFWLLVLLGTYFLKVYRPAWSWTAALAFSALMEAFVYSLATKFSFVSSYPLSLGWSEVSRYYGASLLFAQRIYSETVPLSILHPTWHFLLAIPFIFGNLPLWVHRLWQALLQVALPAAFSFLLARRLNLRRGRWYAAVLLWSFLFLMQGPILINVMVCSILVLWGVSPKKFWRTTITVLVASIWAGMSRINWYPVPGLFAAVIFLLDVPCSDAKRFIEYAWKPVFWFALGLAAALASDFMYIYLSGNAAQSGQFFSSLTSQLLWYRLLPNATYPPGILPMILLASLPVWLVIAFQLHNGKREFHPFRLAGILATLVVLLMGGLVVSVKIGGSTNLHNMDAYLILVLLVASFLFFGKYGVESGRTHGMEIRNIFVLLLLVAVPAWMAVRFSTPFFRWNVAQTQKAISDARAAVDETVSNRGQVLFISQRHLLTFGMIKAPLIPEYEQDQLMEMVMSNNRAYLDQFQSDLSHQRFAMIVALKQETNFQGSAHAAGEENDGWVREVSIPLLCYYQPLNKDAPTALVLYVRRTQPCK